MDVDLYDLARVAELFDIYLKKKTGSEVKCSFLFYLIGSLSLRDRHKEPR